MIKLLLCPLAFIYGFITWVRNFLYDSEILKSKEFKISTIAIGNLSAGGTGKTPHTEYLVKLLKKRFNIAILSRGYKRISKGFFIANPSISYKQIGDEPKQIANKFPNIKVAVCENRVKGIKQLLKRDDKIDIVILDDAFQHRRLKSSISILLMDYNYPFYEDKLLPCGRLRESWQQYCRANIIIITKVPKTLKPIDRRLIAKNINLLPYQTIYFTTLKYTELKPVFKAKKINIDNIDKKYDILIITAIARTQLFINYVTKNISDQITHFKFSDHHNFNKKDITKIVTAFEKIQNTKKIIICTEKDAVKLRENKYIHENYYKYFFYIPIEIEFLFDSEEEFNNQIINNITKNKTNYELQISLKQF